MASHRGNLNVQKRREQLSPEEISTGHRVIIREGRLCCLAKAAFLDQHG